VLLIILVVGGTIYVYYTDRDVKQAPVKTVSTQSQPDQAVKPVKISANAPEGVAIQELTSPVSIGSEASLSVETDPGSKCTVTATYAGKVNTNPGLAPQIATDFGNVSWNWTIDSSVPVGSWPVQVWCVYNGRSGMVIGTLQVVK